MFWFRRPPYLRWLGAAVLIGAGLVAEFRPTAMVVHPFATDAVEPGMQLEGVDWREIPAGILPPPPELTNMVARRRLAAGEPLLAGAVSPAEVGGPRGWWALSMEVPALVAPGTAARVIVSDPPLAVDAVVLAAAAADPFSTARPTALVAVPPEQAAPVAAAAAAGRATVLVAPPE